MSCLPKLGLDLEAARQRRKGFHEAPREHPVARQHILEGGAEHVSHERGQQPVVRRAAGIAEDAQEGFLRQVFALSETTRGAVGQRTDQRLIAGNNLAKGIAIAIQTRCHQLRVVVSGCRHMLQCHHITT